jgi:hypothetical protein
MKYLILLLVTVFVGFHIEAQENKLIYPEKTQKGQLKGDNKDIVDYYVSINFDIASQLDQFVLQFGDENYTVRKERFTNRGIDGYGFYAVNESNDGHILISVLGDDIQGTVKKGEDVYSIQTLGNGQYAIVRVEANQKEMCENLEVFEGIEAERHKSHDSEEIHSANISPQAITHQCKIRVLCFYTQNAATQAGNIRNTCLLATEESNQAFINSNINYRIELVYVGSTTYTESTDMDTDLNRFAKTSDGYMDDVHTLRDTYAADVCVLLTHDSGPYCGIAKGINVDAANAFCVVDSKAGCATAYYSFIHEIGHLVGCRHDTYVDPNTTPYAYGHGYISPQNNWRTIMAYGNGCGGCNRVQYFSNPNISYNGLATGTTATNNNARVWNERSNTVMGFRQPSNTLTVSSTMVANSLQSDLIAKQSITTNGTINISGTKALSLRSNTITIQPGFTIQNGASFLASNENVVNCP